MKIFEFTADFKNIAWNDDRLYKDNGYFLLRSLLFLNGARPVSLAGDRFALRSLHQLSSLSLSLHVHSVELLLLMWSS